MSDISGDTHGPRQAPLARRELRACREVSLCCLEAAEGLRRASQENGRQVPTLEAAQAGRGGREEVGEEGRAPAQATEPKKPRFWGNFQEAAG